MRILEGPEVDAVSGGNPFLWVTVVLTAVAISDGLQDFADGYQDARDNR